MKRSDALRKNILLYRLLLIFGANGLMTAVIYFFFTTIKGFNTAEALFLIGITVLTKALAEVPTGVIADKFSRKYSILIGYAITLIGWLGILVTTGYGLILLFIVFIGIGSSFISGADDALLYDSLKELNRPHEFKKIYNLSASIELFAFALTILIGGALAGINLYWPLFATLLLISFSVVISFFLIEPSISKRGEKIEQIGYILHTKNSIRTIFSKSAIQNGLIGSFLSLALIFAVFRSTKIILSPVLNQYGLAIPSIGLIVSAIILVKAIGAFIASKISRSGNELKEVIIGLAVCITGLFLIAFVHVPLFQLFIFVVIIGFDNIITTDLNTIINDKIESKQRSTVLSLHSLFARTTEMLFLTSFGWVIDLYPIKIAFLLTVTWLVLAALTLVVLNKVRVFQTFHLVRK